MLNFIKKLFSTSKPVEAQAPFGKPAFNPEYIAQLETPTPPAEPTKVKKPAAKKAPAKIKAEKKVPAKKATSKKSK